MSTDADAVSTQAHTPTRPASTDTHTSGIRANPSTSFIKPRAGAPTLPVAPPDTGEPARHFRGKPGSSEFCHRPVASHILLGRDHAHPAVG
jgi:hypothetical protein